MKNVLGKIITMAVQLAQINHLSYTYEFEFCERNAWNNTIKYSPRTSYIQSFIMPFSTLNQCCWSLLCDWEALKYISIKPFMHRIALKWCWASISTWHIVDWVGLEKFSTTVELQSSQSNLSWVGSCSLQSTLPRAPWWQKITMTLVIITNVWSLAMGWSMTLPHKTTCGSWQLAINLLSRMFEICDHHVGINQSPQRLLEVAWPDYQLPSKL